MSFDNNPTAVRVYALQEAVKYAAGSNVNTDTIVAAAGIFLDFLNGGQSAVTATESASSTATSKKGSSTASAKKPAPAKAEPKPEPTAEEVFETRKKLIGAKVEAALAANKRAEAVELMKSYGANSVTALAQSDANITEVLEKFEEILLAA